MYLETLQISIVLSSKGNGLLVLLPLDPTLLKEAESTYQYCMIQNLPTSHNQNPVDAELQEAISLVYQGILLHIVFCFT